MYGGDGKSSCVLGTRAAVFGSPLNSAPRISGGSAEAVAAGVREGIVVLKGLPK